MAIWGETNKLTKIIVVSLFIAIVINIVIITNIGISSLFRSNETFPEPQKSQLQSNILEDLEDNDFYDLPCPDLELRSFDGNSFQLQDFIGDIIIIRFTTLHAQDLPNLLYLDHLFNKFRSENLHPIFIKYLSSNEPYYDYKLLGLTAPIVEDDGYIASIFNAKLNDTIIIGQDFRIKFKHNQASNKVIKNQLMRYLFNDQYIPENSNPFYISRAFKKLNFHNIRNDTLFDLGEVLNSKKVVLQLFVSTCDTCPSIKRFNLMEELALKNRDSQIILLFGTGNQSSQIKSLLKSEIPSNLIVGILEKPGVEARDDYYKVFNLDIDPRFYIFRDGEIKYAEKRTDEAMLDANFMLKLLHD